MTKSACDRHVRAPTWRRLGLPAIVVLTIPLFASCFPFSDNSKFCEHGSFSYFSYVEFAMRTPYNRRECNFFESRYRAYAASLPATLRAVQWSILERLNLGCHPRIRWLLTVPCTVRTPCRVARVLFFSSPRRYAFC